MERMDKSQVRRVKTSEQESDSAYWRDRTPVERRVGEEVGGGA